MLHRNRINLPLKSANFFSSGSPYLNHPLLTPERTAMEVDFILSRIELGKDAQILDMGCGAGRHSLELAGRGYQVVGIDPSAAMIAAAHSSSSGLDPKPEFIQMRGEDFTTTKQFDAGICLFTTLGQMVGERDNSELVSRVYESLRLGGFFIVEVPNRNWVISNLKTHEHFEDETRSTLVTRRYYPEHHIVEEKFNVASLQGEKNYLLRYRVYNQDELLTRLQEVGFRIISKFGGYDGKPLEDDCPVMIIFSHKPQLRGI